MTKKYLYTICFSLLTMLFVLLNFPLKAQTSNEKIKGIIIESGTKQPLKQVSVSVSTTGENVLTNENGEFEINVPGTEIELLFNLPGYNKKNIYLNGREEIVVSLVSSSYRSFDNEYNTPNGTAITKDAVYSNINYIANELYYTKATSFDQTLQGKVPGMSSIIQSGMPGQRTYMNIWGASSMYGNSEPLLIIDGMIYDYTYASGSLMEGFALNPMDILDIDDLSDITVLKNGLSYLGSLGSNGVINVNTEQKSEASTVMKFSTYGGITLAPQKIDVLGVSEYKNYFSEILQSKGLDGNQINTMYPWLNGGSSAQDFYKYNNNTDWQDEIYGPASVSKFHFFLKGGDDIATYNISTGYLAHNGIYENSSYSRYNLRVNGKINITNKFSVVPNVKLSLADSKLANHGTSVWKNPLVSSLLKPPTMASFARDASTGITLDYLDDVGDVIQVSNPSAIVKNAVGTNRNYHFLSSVTAQYNFNENLSVSSMVGINFNNSRENIFLPNIGIVQVDSSYNSPGDYIFEFRSTQNHTAINYNKKTSLGHELNLKGGFRYMQNTYKYNRSLDLNTPSDDFKSLGQGSQFSFLRTTMGDNRGLKWISYYGDLNYNFRNKYYANVNVSYDANSATNKNNRYNLFPSVGLAWRISSENFLNQTSWLEDLKVRASYSNTGNMFSSVYDYSKLYYTDRRMNSLGVLTREIIPNEEMELEKTKKLNIGLDLSVFQQLANIHVNLFKSNIDNLIIKQELPSTFGYIDYYDNGGKLESTGFDVSADTRVGISNVEWRFGVSVSKQIATVKDLTFLNPAEEDIVTTVGEAQYITSVDNALNAFYGYKTNGLISSGDAGKITGPKGLPMQEGDIRFVDNGDNVINEEDKVIIGNPNPELYGGIFTSFAYKNIKLAAYLNYSVGNDIYNFVRSQTEALEGLGNQSVTVLDRWTTSNPNSELPRISYGDPTGNNVFSDRWIEDGSYLRLGQLTLSYDVPPIPGFLKGIGVYLTATNLFTITGYSGYDTDFSYINSPFFLGLDNGKIPQSQSFIIGLKLDL